MDESWRVSTGSKLSRRRSAEQTRRLHPALEAEDFRDVFGGPPRTVLLRKFSGEFSPRATAYNELFRPPKVEELSWRVGQGCRRTLPGFRIPTTSYRPLLRTEEGFYDDIFGANGGDRRSRTRSKCSSVLSSEDVSSELRGIEDSGLSGFASKLRPITIPSRCHYSPPSTISSDEQNSLSTLSINAYPLNSYFQDGKDTKSNRSSDLYRQKSHLGFSCCFSPPETISLEASFRGNYMKPLHCDNSDADSPSSVISSIYIDPKAEKEVEKAVIEIEEMAEAPLSSYRIKFDSHDTVSEEGAAAVDEAIAWAKQKFWSHQTLKEVDVKDDYEVYSSDSISII